VEEDHNVDCAPTTSKSENYVQFSIRYNFYSSSPTDQHLILTLSSMIAVTFMPSVK
jgi:hypothetical protein